MPEQQPHPIEHIPIRKSKEQKRRAVMDTFFKAGGAGGGWRAAHPPLGVRHRPHRPLSRDEAPSAPATHHDAKHTHTHTHTTRKGRGAWEEPYIGFAIEPYIACICAGVPYAPYRHS